MVRAFSPKGIPSKNPGALPQAGMGLGLWPGVDAFLIFNRGFYALFSN